jgi:thiosulfate reductase cytochrome b subunit
MDPLTPTLALGSEQVIQVVLVILAVIIALFILRFVVNIAVSAFRIAMWIGVAIIVIYVLYSLVQGRIG